MVHTFFRTNAFLGSRDDLFMTIDYILSAIYDVKYVIYEFYKSIFSNVAHSTDYGQSQVRYYCMKCGNEHREIACPKCGSKIKRVGL